MAKDRARHAANLRPWLVGSLRRAELVIPNRGVRAVSNGGVGMDMSRKSAAAAGALLLLAGALASCGGKTSSSTTEKAAGSALPPSSWIVPVDVANASTSPSPSPAPQQSDWLNFGWQTFVALNWPATAPATTSGISGLPNTQLSIGAQNPDQSMVPTVWLTYRSDANTMLAGAQDPGPWSSNPVPLPPACNAPSPQPGFQPMYLNMTTKFGNSQEASGSPLIAQNGWYVTYDIRLNQSEYTYIQQNQYFNATTQINTEQNQGKLLPFPRSGTESMFNPPLPQLAQFGALEVKAAWRVLDPTADKAVIPRYYTQTGYFLQPNGQCQGPTLFGLIGMHILRLTPTTPSTWYWATFEQVDNVTSSQDVPATLATANTPNGNCTSAYNVQPTSPPGGNVPWNSANPPVNVCRVTNIGADVQQINQSWQNNLAGTVWANYELVGTINPVVANATPYPVPPPPTNPTSVNTDTLLNSSMETYVQAPGTSCLSCHASATPQGVTQPSTTNQIFTFVLGDAVSPTGGHILKASAHGVQARRQHPLPKQVLDILRNHGARTAPRPSSSPVPPAPSP
jgi:hypothetical protein